MANYMPDHVSGVCVMQQRRRFKQTSTLQVRLVNEAEQLRTRAAELPQGSQRESLLQRIREIDNACNMIQWIEPPRLQPLS